VPEAAASRSRPTTELLERSGHLAALEASLAAVLNGSNGRLVLIRGEAGVGKSVLLRRFCDANHDSARILWGACDALFTPRPLGPFLDIAEVTAGELQALVESSSRPHELAAGLIRELARRPAVLVLEDVHWADEATLDVLKLLARRIEPTRALALASYRDDELDRDHPLRIVLGELATFGAIERLSVEPLSETAVAKLAEPRGVNATELYRVTRGNPFFINEVLAASGERIPPTVRDAVLARAARLGAGARTLHSPSAALRRLAPPESESRPARSARPRVLPHRPARCSVEAQQSAVACRRVAGDALKEGDARRSLARLLGFVGRTHEAAETCRQAVALLEQLEPGRELAMAYGKLAQRCVNWEDVEGAVGWGTRALQLAERLEDVEIQVYALATFGAAEFRTDSARGREKLERSVELAKAAGLEDHVGRALINLAWLSARTRSFAAATRYVESGLEYCEERGLDYWRLSLLGCRARLELDQGRWTEAAGVAALVLSDPREAPVPRVLAAVVQGLVRARRGAPGVWPQLDEAHARAKPTAELQQIAPVAAARAEAAWLEGRNRDAVEATEAALELARRCPAPWEIGELASWRRRAGISEEVALPATARPFTLQMRGDGAGAAELWTEIGCRLRGRAGAWRHRRRRSPEEGPRRAPGDGRRAGRRDRCPSFAPARRARSVQRASSVNPTEPREPDSARARRAQAGSGGASQRRDCRPAVPLSEDGRSPRLGDPAQARGAHARRGERRGEAPRARWERWVTPPAM